MKKSTFENLAGISSSPETSELATIIPGQVEQGWSIPKQSWMDAAEYAERMNGPRRFVGDYDEQGGRA